MNRFLFLILFLAGCSTAASNPEFIYQRGKLFQPTLDNFPHCRSYGCAKVDRVTLTEQDYAPIAGLFRGVQSAEEERKAITHAIALFEQKVGAITGTQADIAGTYVKLGHLQQDCVDESTNTTTYLVLLKQMDVLKFHHVNALTSRAPILSGRLGPHRTAVITELDTGTKYAVDSWFHDNGKPAEIVALETWKNGWHPDR